MKTQIAENNKISKKDFYNCWKFNSDKGRQFWTFQPPIDYFGLSESEFYQQLSEAFVYDKSFNANTSDLVLREKFAKQGKEPETVPEFKSNNQSQAYKAAYKGFDFYNSLQMPDGNWAGDYGGPMFLLPGLIFVSYITQTPFDNATTTLMKRYMLNHQNENGGWGLHIEDKSTMFGTVLQYVALRILGESEETPQMQLASQWIKSNGGATQIPLWGKFYLTVLGLYSWEGNNSFYPESWILPESLPIHPSKYWNHARMVYMPMSYCFAVKLQAASTPLIEKLKSEIFFEPFEQINWQKAKDACCEKDLYFKPSKILSFANVFLNAYEKFHSKYLRKKAVNFLTKYIDAEDRHTNYINVGPVNQVLNSLCVWHIHGKESEQFQKHVDRWKDYLWLAEDGMKMNGYNGSQLWDTGFATQALLEAKMADQFPETAAKIYQFIDYTQIKKNETDYDTYYRDKGLGCWPFSTRDHDWPITDCTAEGMKCVIGLNQTHAVKNNLAEVSLKRLEPAVDFLLKLQNKDGGWATYENIRGPKWLEKLNPAHIFADIMIEYSYVECSSSSMQALSKILKYHPDYRSNEIKQSLEKGRRFIEKKQLADGSWYGSWAVCFTYGTWFGIEGLIAAGADTYQAKKVNPHIQKACEFLISKQQQDGSWGESYLSCVNKKYTQHAEGQIINTAWALLALMAAHYPNRHVIDKGIAFLIKMQNSNGDWPQQSISGVFNANCMITYTSYRNVFPLWALGRYIHLQ
jgi:squalene/oxidosqualene cyclase-like protein